jgi:hypothetical protein
MEEVRNGSIKTNRHKLLCHTAVMLFANCEYAGSSLEALIVTCVRNFTGTLKFKALDNQQR